jgi:hypothetical protein
MEKSISKRTLKESIAQLFRCLCDLVALRSVRSGEGSAIESKEIFALGVDRLLELYDHIKGWDIDSQDLFERDGSCCAVMV